MKCYRGKCKYWRQDGYCHLVCKNVDGDKCVAVQDLNRLHHGLEGLLAYVGPACSFCGKDCVATCSVCDNDW